MQKFEKITQEELNNIQFEGDIHTIIIQKSKIYEFPQNFFPLSVIRITINGTKFKNIQKELFNLPNLEELNLFDNHIEVVDFTVPDNLSDINLSYNMVKEVNFEDTKNIERINLEYNKLTSIPECLMNKNDIIRNFGHNDFPFTQHIGRPRVNIPPDVRNALDDGIVPANNREQFERIVATGRDHREMMNQIFINNYKNNNNVHTGHIQDSTRRAIQNLMKLPEPVNKNYYKEMRKYYLKQEGNYIKKMLYWLFNPPHVAVLYTLTLSNYTFVPDYGSIDKAVTYGEVLERVWAYAKNHSAKKDIMENLRIQLLDGVGYCNVGKMTRIVNSLASFTDIVVYDEPKNVKLGNKISEIKKRYEKLYDPDSKEFADKCAEEFKTFMNDINISPEEQQVWLDPLYDTVIEDEDEPPGYVDIVPSAPPKSSESVVLEIG